MPGGVQCYCAPVASFFSRCRGSCRRRLAGECSRSRAGTVLRFRFGSAAVSRPSVDLRPTIPVQFARWVVSAPARFKRGPLDLRSTAHVCCLQRARVRCGRVAWAVRCSIDGPREATSFIDLRISRKLYLYTEKGINLCKCISFSW